MKKAIWSAFAMSLLLLSFCACAQSDSVRDFLGYDDSVLPELEGPQRFTNEKLHDDPEWKVTKAQVETDKEPLRGQNYSIIPWGEQSPEKFLDINTWLVERSLKDKNPDWKIRVRDQRHTELMGKILNCQGKCEIFRGLESSSGSYRSKLFEGDEIHVGVDSYAWIYLMDGSLVRLSSETAVNFQELNVGKENFFVLLRLNHGHIYWHPKDHSALGLDLAPETDGGSLPLMLLDANIQQFERKRFSTSTDAGQLFESGHLDEEAIKDQTARINQLREEHQKFKDYKSQVMIVSPNVTVVGTMASFDFLSLLGSKSFLKKRSAREQESLTLQLRGYLNTDEVPVTSDAWLEISENGREQVAMSDIPAHLQVTELLTKRIKTIELAREMWFSLLTAPIISSVGDGKKLGVDYGYVLWEKGMTERFQFLSEYTRRIETTNLRSIENLLKKTPDELRPETILSEKHYRAALNDYLLGLKTRYTDKKMQVREMNDLQYYVWALRHGKFKN